MSDILEEAKKYRKALSEDKDEAINREYLSPEILLDQLDGLIEEVESLRNERVGFDHLNAEWCKQRDSLTKERDKWEARCKTSWLFIEIGKLEVENAELKKKLTSVVQAIKEAGPYR